MLVFSDTKDHTYARELSVRGYHGVYGVVYYRGGHPPVFHAQQCLSDHLFWGTHFSSAAPLKSAVASFVPIVRHLAIHCLRYNISLTSSLLLSSEQSRWTQETILITV